MLDRTQTLRGKRRENPPPKKPTRVKEEVLRDRETAALGVDASVYLAETARQAAARRRAAGFPHLPPDQAEVERICAPAPLLAGEEAMVALRDLLMPLYAFQADGRKKQSKQRIVTGMRQVARAVDAGPKVVKLVVLSSGLEVQSAGIERCLRGVVEACQRDEVPVLVVAGSRMALGRLLSKRPIPVSMAAVTCTDGAHEAFVRVLSVSKDCPPCRAEDDGVGTTTMQPIVRTPLSVDAPDFVPQNFVPPG